MAFDCERLFREIEARVSARYAPAEHPALRAQLARFRAERPFAGLALLDCTPLFENTLAKFLPLLAGGAELSVGLDARIPRDSRTAGFLERIGMPVLSGPADSAQAFDVVLDCGGTRANLAPRLGVCELTRSGVYHYGDARTPVVLVDASKIKEIETTLGTGDGYMRAMRQFGYGDWSARRVVVFGYGKVGRGVAWRCAAEGARVTAVDRTDVGIEFDRTRLEAVVDCRDAAAVREAVAACDVVVTATGVRGALREAGLGDVIRARPEMVVSAVGIEDEWLDALESGRILNGGAPVNFALEEPTLLRYIDPTMALSNQSAADLAAGAFAGAGIRSPRAESERTCLGPVLEEGLIADELAAWGFGSAKTSA